MDTYLEQYSPTDDQTTTSTDYVPLSSWGTIDVPLVSGTTYLVEVSIGDLRITDSNNYENAYVAVFKNRDPNSPAICQAGISRTSGSKLRMNLSARGIDTPTDEAEYSVYWKVDNQKTLTLLASGTNLLTVTPISEPSSEGSA